jgi:TAT-translocated FGD2 family F420-dependent dehydrogenase
MSQVTLSASGDGFPNFGRRDVLKSAGALLAASPMELGAADAQTSTEPESESPAAEVPPLHKGMIAFTLAHEQFTIPQLVKIGTHADRSGFDVLATSDHFQPWQANERHAGEAWVTLGALGQHARRTWMGTSVTCPTLRYNPAVVAQAFASLSQLCPGRIFLGLGSGEALNEEAATGRWPAWRERWDRLIEAVQIIRGLWGGEPLAHKGTHYTVTGRLYDPPSKPIPLLLAANGPKAMRLAGQHGDGLITDPQTWKQYKGEWQSAAAAAGKNVAGMPVMVEQFVVVGDKNDAQLPAQLWNFLPKAFKGYQNMPDPVEIQRRAQSELPLPKVYGDWTVSSDPNVHLETIESLLASGVTIVNIHSGQADQKAVIDFYAKDVLPRAKARTQSS